MSRRPQCYGPEVYLISGSGVRVPTVHHSFDGRNAETSLIARLVGESGLEEGVAGRPEPVAFGKRARKGKRPMGTCVMCKRSVQQAENWIRCHLWGGFAIFHWRCFGEYLRAESEEQVESAVWEASRNG